MSQFLEQMEIGSRTRLEAASGIANLEVQRRRAELNSPSPLPDGFLVFAEVKPASPADGELADGGFVEQAIAYEAGGASAVSVLTEPLKFGGSLGLMEEVVSKVDLPIMRKDFLIDPYQVWEARAHGASGVLLIVRMLAADVLHQIIGAVSDAEMFAVLEAFDRADLEAISALDVDGAHLLAGVNSRDLDTLEVRDTAHEDMADYLPDGMVTIAESGIGSAGRVRRLRDMGYGGVLVGSSLMRSDDPATEVAAIVAEVQET